MKRHSAARKDRTALITANGFSVPGGVYLCQVNRRVSCGACCGLYNVADAAYETLAAMLNERTKDFAHVPRQADAIAAFGQLGQLRSGAGPYSEFHHCPFVGLIGEDRRRVGCLLHPHADGNRGVDYRGMSYYGGMACRLYFCPAHNRLSPVIKMVVRESAANWYDYGLVITESGLLHEFFTILENRLGSPLRVTDITGCKQCRQMMAHVLRLKIDWPFRRRPDPGICHYMFDDRLYPKPALGYPSPTAAPSAYHALLEELRSAFETRSDLELAEKLLADLIDTLTEKILRNRHARACHSGEALNNSASRRYSSSVPS